MSEEKKKGPARDLPQDVLDIAHRVWLAGLGALSTAQDEGDRLFRQLVDRGREMEGQGRETVQGAAGRARATAGSVREGARTSAESVRESARSAAEGVGEALDARVGSVLSRLGVPTRSEIHELTRRIEELNAQVERLHRAPAPAAPKPASTVPVKPVSSPAARPVPTSGTKPAGGAKSGGGAKTERSTAAGTGAGTSAGKATAAKPSAPKPPGTKKPGTGEGGA